MNEPLRLGLMPPLTGLVELYGPEIVTAARIACDEINASGGVLGRPLELIIEDDGSVPASAVPAAQRLIDEHRCVALIGNLLSNSRIAVASQIAEPRRVPYLNFSFYEGSIFGRYFFHFAALPNQQIDQMIPFMVRRYGPKIFFAGNNYEWPRGSIDAAQRALARCDGDSVGEEYLPLGVTVEEIDALLARVARSGADVFVPYFAGSDQIMLLTRFTELGLKRRMAVVMGHYDEMMVSRMPPEVRVGFYSSNTYFMTLDTPGNRRYLQHLARQPGVTGIWPNGNGIVTNFGEGTYLCVKAFAAACASAGTTAAEALVAALERVRIEGPQGWVAMDPATHHATVNTYLARCTAAGEFVIIERFGANRPEIPARYRAQARVAKIHESPTNPEVTARLAAEIRATRRRFGNSRHILALADIAVLAADANGIITEANRAACAIFGYEETELLGLSVHLLVPPPFRQRHEEHLRAFLAGETQERRMSERSELSGYRKDGSFFPLEASIAKFCHDGEWTLVITLRDISARKQIEEELIRRATHDVLTGLPNRALIRERLIQALHRSRRSAAHVALLFVDLDGFKLINDTHGHEAGDHVLQTVAARLIEQVRPGDTVARLAGDEFLVLCEQIEQPSAITVLAERINAALRKPLDYHGVLLCVSASIGIAVGCGNTHTADDLLRSADTAMYAVKQQGRDGWQFFSESLHEQARQRLTLITGLRLAIERQELAVRFQPIVTAEQGRIVGAELLLRWHPPAGEVAPATFIPVAETIGAIVPIGAWVLRAACHTEVTWRQRWGAEAPYVTLNLSPRQLNEATVLADVDAIVHDTGADPRRITLELTETALMAEDTAHVQILRQLADRGFRIAVDNFGRGYSSLARLTRLPLDILKIDRSLIADIETSAENRSVVRAVIGLGRALDLQLIAAGIERAEQWQELRAQGCDLLQGNYFFRPLEPAAFLTAVENPALCARRR